MPYSINKYTGALIATVADGTVDQSTSLKLVGKNYAGYGEIQNENFIYLLENFASPAPGPDKPLPGQLWFDTQNNKLNFRDNNGRWRTAGGSSAAPPPGPTGLTTGDFWFDTTNNQLYVWNSVPSPGKFVLVGPEGVPGSGVTQMISASVLDTNNVNHTIIKAVVDDQVVFVINTDAAFTLDEDSAITGFDTVQQGITLAYTNDETEEGVTQNNFRFWGTASNSDRLGGLEPSDYVSSDNPTFNSQVHFPNDGLTIGSTYTLEMKLIGGIPNIQNIFNNEIKFNTTVSGALVTPLRLVGKTLQPGSTDVNIGTSTNPYNVIYANSFAGPSTQSDALKVGSTYVGASTESLANTIAARTNVNTIVNGVTCGPGSIKATYFVGTATAALYADLAEKFLPDNDYLPGTVVMIGGEKEVTASTFGSNPIGVVSTDPAYIMNSALEGGVAIALKGRVPVFVSGPIRKGEQVIAGDNGVGLSFSQDTNQAVFGISLETNDDPGIKLVECVIL